MSITDNYCNTSNKKLDNNQLNNISLELNTHLLVSHVTKTNHSTTSTEVMSGPSS